MLMIENDSGITNSFWYETVFYQDMCETIKEYLKLVCFVIYVQQHGFA